MSVRQWLRERRQRKWLDLVNGHDFVTTQDQPNKRVEITCRRCGYVHTDIDPFVGPPWIPFTRVETPCIETGDGMVHIDDQQ